MKRTLSMLELAIVASSAGAAGLFIASLSSAQTPQTINWARYVCGYDYPCPTSGSRQCHMPEPNPAPALPWVQPPTPPYPPEHGDPPQGYYDCFICKDSKPRHRCYRTNDPNDTCSFVLHFNDEATCGEKQRGYCAGGNPSTYPTLCLGAASAGICQVQLCADTPGGPTWSYPP